MERINVLYLIWTYNEGIGGHYQSFISTINSIDKRKINIYVINLGYQKALSLKYLEVEYEFFQVTLININLIKKKLKRFIINHSIDLIHSYDYSSYYFIKKIDCPSLVTYPGGNNEKWFPQVRYSLMFSKENFNYFNSSDRYSNTKFFLLTNRVKNIEPDTIRINNLLRTYEPTGLKLIKIARIGSYYEKSIISSIDFSLALSSKNIENTLYIIGFVESEYVLNRIKEKIDQSSNKIYLITDNYYTNSANRLIHFGDIILATGRGIMEGLAIGKLVFAPCNEGYEQTLVSKNNIDYLEYYNFSERSIVPQIEDYFTYIKDNNKLIEYKSWAKSIFIERYSTQYITLKLLDIYKEIYDINISTFTDNVFFFLKIRKFFVISYTKRIIQCLKKYKYIFS